MRRARLSADPLEPRETPTILPTGFAEAVINADLTRPTATAIAPDGRLFVAEQGGALRVIQNGQLLPTPFVSLNVDSEGERGLLGVTLDPNFAANNLVYVYYTVPVNGPNAPFNRVSRFTADGNVAAAGSEQVLVNLDTLSRATNHNGGAIHFGADGKLYVAAGENANPPFAQSLTTRHGKILRYNPDGTIPGDNPAEFAGINGTTTGVNRAIWAVGLRNPFTFAVQPGTGRIFINDVGQNSFEEINEGGPGRNFGWPATEGDFDPGAFPNFTRPLFDYPHGSGNNAGFAITGAAFYNPTDNAIFPAEYHGDYFFGDLVNRWIRRYDPVTKAVTLFASDLTVGGLVDLDVTPDGDLLYTARGNGGAGQGGVFRIRFTLAPQIAVQPTNVAVQPGQDATFSVTASGNAPITYQWQRDGVDIPGATSPTYTLLGAQLSDSGAVFRVVVRNDFATVTSRDATLTVSENLPPVPTITSPAAGTRFIAGQTFTFSGTAADPEDGDLPASAFTWRVDYITGGAPDRPLVPETSGITSGMFTIPTITPYTLPDVLYRVVLTVRDSAGATATVTRDLQPVTAAVTLAASGVSGVTLTLDGQPVAVPHTFTGVAGVERQLGAPATLTSGGQTFVFTRWQDGPTANPRTISTPTAATTFTAVYQPEGATSPPVPIVVGADATRPPVVRTLNPTTGAELATFDLRTVTLGSPGFTGETRVAIGDVTGDGVPDVVVGAGPGGPSFVVVYDGKTGGVITTPTIFEPSFTGGVYVAVGDVDGDGKADVIVTPDQGGGPRVHIFRIGDNAVIADFFGIEDPNFRGGARASAGDVNGDGRVDVVVSAGFLGGPRIAGWDGRQLADGKLVKVFADFFAFEETLRNGVFVAAGDLNSDGKADLILGGGPGGGPRVLALNGADLVTSNAKTVLGNFFAGDDASRDGVRVAAKDIDADGKLDVLAGLSGRVRGYVGSALPGAGSPTPQLDVPAFDDGFAGLVYVG